MLSWDGTWILDRDHIIDAQSGFAIDYPLTRQLPALFWLTPSGQAIRRRIETMRRELGLEVDDNIDDE